MFLCISNSCFFYRNLILFREKNYKKQTQIMFLFYNSLALDTVDIFSWKKSRCLTWLALFALFLKNTPTTLLLSDWFCLILKLDLKITSRSSHPEVFY